MLRFATMNDADMLLRWRNDPTTRASRVDDREINLEEHIAWLRRRQASPSCVYIYYNSVLKSVGQIVLDVDLSPSYEMGWIVAPEHRDRGWGTAMAQEAIMKVLPPLAHIWCKVGKNNIASIKLAQKLGFQKLEPRTVFNNGYEKNAYERFFIFNLIRTYEQWTNVQHY